MAERPDAAAYVFLSYTSTDRVRALALADTLQAAGVTVWLDRSSIAGGTSWGSAIVEGIKRCAALLILCSTAALQSRNVKQEIQLAWRFERAYVPLLLEPVAFPEQVQYFLEGWQWVELLDRPQSVWLPVLLKALTRLGVTGTADGTACEPPVAAAGGAAALGGARTAPAQPASLPAASVFVGRQDELDRLRAAQAAAMAGQGRLVLLAGEPGIGKTRLAQHLAHEATGRGCLVLWGRCWEGEGAPAFWPWLQALGAYARSQEPQALRTVLGTAAADLAQLVPEVHALLPDLPAPVMNDHEQARFRLFGGITACLQAIATAQPLLLVLDDLHWADKPSLLLLQYLARELGATRLLLLGTYRDTDLERGHALAEVLAGLRREPAFERMALSGLTLGELTALLEANTGERLDRVGLELAATLHRETEGNPFFVAETLRHLEETGGIVRQAGGWQVTTASIAALGIPEGVREVIGRRLSRLSADCNQLLAIAAVLGREFDAEILEQVSGQPADAVDEALAAATSATLLAELRKSVGHYRFSHALIRETLLQELPTRRRVRLHRQVGESLVAHYGARAGQHAAALAYHFTEAAGASEADTVKALHWSKLAGEQAEAATAWEEAWRQYERCLALLAEAETPLEADEAALLVAAGRCARDAADYATAWSSLMRAITVYRQRGDSAGIARATLEALFPFRTSEGTARLLDEALAALGEADPALRFRLLRERYMQDNSATAEQAAAQAIELGTRHQFAGLRQFVAMREFRRAQHEGQYEDARRLAREVHAAAAEAGDFTGMMFALNGIAGTAQHHGRLDEAIAAAREYRAEAQRLHLRLYEWTATGYLATVALRRCDDAGFAGYLQELPRESMRTSFLLSTGAEMTSGPDASLLFDPLDPVLPSTQRVTVYGQHARVLFLLGDEAGARRALDAWSETLPRSAPFPWPNHALGAADDSFPALGAAALVEELYTAAAAQPWVRVSGPLFGGMDHILGALALRLERIDAAEGHYQTGLAWAERERCPIEQARCLEGLAEVALRRGEATAATACFTRASALFEAHGAVFYLARLRSRQEALTA